MASSFKLRLVRFSAKLRFQDRTECGNKNINVIQVFLYILSKVMCLGDLLSAEIVHATEEKKKKKLPTKI